jgi:hypothetical protein
MLPLGNKSSQSLALPLKENGNNFSLTISFLTFLKFVYHKSHKNHANAWKHPH